jgi:hypothetical protein
VARVLTPISIAQGHRAVVCDDGACAGASLEKIEVVIDGEDVCLVDVSLAATLTGPKPTRRRKS